MSKSEFHFVLFARSPELGKVKSRLALSIGNERALKYYLELLNYNDALFRSINALKKLFFKGDRNFPVQLFQDFDFYEQSGNDLGQAMLNAQKLCFEQKRLPSVIVGCDCFDLKGTDIKEAFRLLNNNDVVFGPASDGGYYLIAVNQPWPELFDGISWGTSEVLAQSIKQCIDNKLSYALLDVRNDLDDAADLEAYLHFKENNL